MNDDEIRALLTSVEPSRWIDRTPDTVAILRSRVEQAGGDPDAVAEWVRSHGGQVARTPPYRPRGGRRYHQQERPGEEFYIVPTGSLAP